MLQDLISPTLSAAEERHLIEVIQFEGLRQQEAWETLIASHQRAIRGAARRVSKMDPEDAYSAALEEFVRCVKDFDLELGLRLSTMAYPRMANAVLGAASADHLIEVPEGTLKRYLALMKRADGDFNEAYRLASEGGHGITPWNLLAAHRALSEPHDSGEVLGEGQTSRVAGDALSGERSADYFRDRTRGFTPDPGHTEISHEWIAHLFTACSQEQDDAIRLAYGFSTVRTNEMRINAGYREGQPLLTRDSGGDRAVGEALGTSRSTAQRLRINGLAAMKSLIDSDLREMEK